MTVSRRTALAITAGVVATAGRAGAATPIDGGRPAPAHRRFSSPAVEATIARVQAMLAGRSATALKLSRMFGHCFPNTLDTTVFTGGTPARPDTFVITGDIDAMWLRDSSAQLWPYLRLAQQDPALRRLIAGAINRQTDCILIDPYANAFNRGPTMSREFASDETEMRPGVHERKWEVDSLCYPIRLSHGYWRATGDVSPFDARWREAARATLRVLREQQRKHDRGPYRFQRRTAWNPDSVPVEGWGNPARPVGLVVSLFRPSDDAAILPFLVPANMFAAVSLRQLAEMSRRIAHDDGFAAECEALADEIAVALRAHGRVRHPRCGEVWAYEVDGYGNALMMDDANVPSLLAAPYLGWCAPKDPLYRATRALILSDDNPWFRRGSAAAGIGSPHTPSNRIWPIALVMQALTSTEPDEIVGLLRTLATTDAGTGFMHEAFDADDPRRFSRPWFAWANTLFGELILDIAATRPALLRSV